MDERQSKLAAANAAHSPLPRQKFRWLESLRKITEAVLRFCRLHFKLFRLGKLNWHFYAFGSKETITSCSISVQKLGKRPHFFCICQPNENFL
jgi:hypothetical protein